jgi:hypothetical protein
MEHIESDVGQGGSDAAPIRLVVVWAPGQVAAGETAGCKSPGTVHAEEVEGMLLRQAYRTGDPRIQHAAIRVDDADHVCVDVSAGLAPAPPCWCGDVHGSVQSEPTYEG